MLDDGSLIPHSGMESRLAEGLNELNEVVESIWSRRKPAKTPATYRNLVIYGTFRYTHIQPRGQRTLTVRHSRSVAKGNYWFM